MKVLFNQIEDSIKYALSDRSAILIIGSLMAITSFIKICWTEYKGIVENQTKGLV